MKTYFNIDEITQSEIRNMSILCDEINGINLSQGISNLELNENLKTGITLGLEKGLNYYTQFDGLESLKESITKKLKTYNNLNLDNQKVIVTSGATGAFYTICKTLLSPDDEVIVFEPFYGYHVTTIKSVGAKPIYVGLTEDTYDIDYEILIDSISQKTKAILICTPGNPSGKVFSSDELITLGKFCRDNNLFVFTDEIYEYFTFDNTKHVSPASLEEFKDITFTISGFSKTFSITGWRIGYCVVPERYFHQIGYVNDLIYVCSPSILQFSVSYALERLNKSFYDNISEIFCKKRDHICETLSYIGIKPNIPKGAYYVMADASCIKGNNSKEKALYLLEKCKVATVPGSSFYNKLKDDKFLRFCFAKNDDELNKACDNLIKQLR